MPITLTVGGRGGRCQFLEWSGPAGTENTLNSFARNPKNAVPLPVVPQPTSLDYASENTHVATVSGSGQVTAVAPGETFITCTDPATGMRSIDRVTVIAKPKAVASTLTLINN